MEEKEIIRREHSINGKSTRQIARELKHSRNALQGRETVTASAVLNSEDWGGAWSGSAGLDIC